MPLLCAVLLPSDVIEVSQLSVIGRAGVGVDNIDLESAGNAGIMVVNDRIHQLNL